MGQFPSDRCQRMHQRMTANLLQKIKNEKENRRDPGRYGSDTRVTRLLLFLDTGVWVRNFFNLSHCGSRSSLKYILICKRPPPPFTGCKWWRECTKKRKCTHGYGRRVRSEKHVSLISYPSCVLLREGEGLLCLPACETPSSKGPSTLPELGCSAHFIKYAVPQCTSAAPIHQ